MEQRPFGSTGLTVSALGLGAGQVGERDVTDREAATLLNAALDAGITLVDTARGYGTSEERIGRHLAHRRDEFVLATKGGYDIEGTQDWTPENLRGTVERSLRLLRTDRIDVFHLHSCSAEVLARGELQDVLDGLVAAGSVGVAAYSGDNAPLADAAASHRFGSVETSVNLADQWSLRHVLPRHPELGVIAKRPLANAPWRFSERPAGHYAELYWERLRTLALDPAGLAWSAFALRFTVFAPGVDCAIVGTASPQNLARNVEHLAQGPLPDEVLAAVDAAWRRNGTDWPGSV